GEVLKMFHHNQLVAVFTQPSKCVARPPTRPASRSETMRRRSSRNVMLSERSLLRLKAWPDAGVQPHPLRILGRISERQANNLCTQSDPYRRTFARYRPTFFDLPMQCRSRRASQL